MSTPAEPNQTLKQQLDALLKPWDRHDGPGVVLGVAQHGRTLYRAAFGQANVEHRVPMSPTTRVSICSVTKHIACAAVLKLAGEGRLSLDDPIGRWVPELQPATAHPSLRQLMQHTGGVRCHIDVAAFNGLVTHPVGWPLRTMLRQRTVNFEPGEGMMYCNGGYALLSIAVERVAGQPFERYVEEQLFAPLRMDASAAPRTWWPVLPNVATCYLPNPGGGWRHGFAFEEETLGNGSVVSTVDDMLRWAHHLRVQDGPVSLAALTAVPAGTAPGPGDVYRFGLTDETWRGVRLVEHSGGAVGASAHLLMAPDEALEIFVFFNSAEAVSKIARDVASLVLGERLSPAPSTEPVAAAAHPGLRGQYLDEEQGLIVGFDDVAGTLGISMFAGPAVPALQRHEPRSGELPFVVPTAIGPRHFRLAPTDGSLEWLDGGRWRTLRPFELSPPPLPAVLAGLSNADFFSPEAAATLRFDEEGGELRMRSFGEFGLWNFHPRAIAEDMLVFSFYKGAASWLARLTWQDGRVMRLTMSSTRTRGLVFERAQPPERTA